MDYALGLMFFLLAYDALLADRLALSSVALALAAGTRITLGFLLAPAVLFLVLERKPFAVTARYMAVFCLCAFAVYSPMIFSPEAKTLAGELEGHVARQHATIRDLPGLARVVGMYLFTKFGLVVLFLALAFEFVRRMRTKTGRVDRLARGGGGGGGIPTLDCGSRSLASYCSRFSSYWFHMNLPTCCQRFRWDSCSWPGSCGAGSLSP